MMEEKERPTPQSAYINKEYCKDNNFSGLSPQFDFAGSSIGIEDLTQLAANPNGILVFQ
jgi:hypothetical protein